MAKKKMTVLEWIAYWLLVIGGVSWGVLGISRFMGSSFELVQAIFRVSWLTNTVYILVGVAGFVGVITGIKLLTK